MCVCVCVCVCVCASMRLHGSSDVDCVSLGQNLCRLSALALSEEIINQMISGTLYALIDNNYSFSCFSLKASSSGFLLDLIRS